MWGGGDGAARGHTALRTQSVETNQRVARRSGAGPGPPGCAGPGRALRHALVCAAPAPPPPLLSLPLSRACALSPPPLLQRGLV